MGGAFYTPSVENYKPSSLMIISHLFFPTALYFTTVFQSTRKIWENLYQQTLKKKKNCWQMFIVKSRALMIRHVSAPRGSALACVDSQKRDVTALD